MKCLLVLLLPLLLHLLLHLLLVLHFITKHAALPWSRSSGVCLSKAPFLQISFHLVHLPYKKVRLLAQCPLLHEKTAPCKGFATVMSRYINLPASITFTFLPHELSEHADRRHEGWRKGIWHVRHFGKITWHSLDEQSLDERCQNHWRDTEGRISWFPNLQLSIGFLAFEINWKAKFTYQNWRFYDKKSAGRKYRYSFYDILQRTTKLCLISE